MSQLLAHYRTIIRDIPISAPVVRWRRWDSDDDFFAADIKSSCIGMDTGEFIQGALAMGGS
jgi:hypothetical protein